MMSLWIVRVEEDQGIECESTSIPHLVVAHSRREAYQFARRNIARDKWDEVSIPERFYIPDPKEYSKPTEIKL